MENKRIIQVDEKVPFKMLVPLSIQHMFAMFGASVLVPFVFGINPAVVLFMNGLGTLLFILITKGRAPAYLGSSFAFLAPAGIVISKWGYSYALGGFVAVGFCGCVLSLIIYKFGSDWIDVVLPPAAMGPVVALIGLDPDCDHCRICCCVALRNRRFLRSCCSTAFFTPEFFNTKVQMGGDRDHSSGTSGHCIGAYRTSDRNK